MDFNPKITIIIPVYNGARYLREAIDSALAQTYKNIEVIIVNDGSTDGGRTEEIAKSYGDKLRYYHKDNGGVASALNFGIREMRGDYFSWLSHDDVYYPNKIETQLNYLKNGDKNVILYSDYDIIDSESSYIRTDHISHIEPHDFRKAIIIGHPIHGCTALVPKACFEKTGFFRENLKVVQDYDLWFRMAINCKFKHIPDVLIKWRIHPEQGTHTMETIRINECNDYYINCLDELGDTEKSTETDRTKALFNLKVAAILLRRRYTNAAQHAYMLSLTYKKRYLDLKYLYLFVSYHINKLIIYFKNKRISI
jgi:glycosyltransferase involved in cell wall biosynthesis